MKVSEKLLKLGQALADANDLAGDLRKRAKTPGNRERLADLDAAISRAADVVMKGIAADLHIAVRPDASASEIGELILKRFGTAAMRTPKPLAVEKTGKTGNPLSDDAKFIGTIGG